MKAGVRAARRALLRAAPAAALAWAALPLPAAADEYLKPEDFLHQVFGAALPAPALLWPGAAAQQRIKAVLGHPYKQLRLRYWRVERRSAWILDEVGKDEEITIGFAVGPGGIERTAVLAFRETRGWEIRFESFTRQFLGARLTAGDALDKPIDGISGATLSVGAYHRLARLALLLHAELPPVAEPAR